jgi:hypothetical protein
VIPIGLPSLFITSAIAISYKETLDDYVPNFKWLIGSFVLGFILGVIFG